MTTEILDIETTATITTTDAPAARSAGVKTVKPEIAALSDELSAVMSVDANTGVTSVPANTYEDLLKKHTSVSPEMIIEFQKFNTNFVAAGAHAFGQTVLPAMANNKALAVAELSVPMVGRDTLEFTLNRQAETSDGNGGKKVVHGQIRVKFDVHARGNRGQFAIVKDQLALQAASLFS